MPTATASSERSAQERRGARRQVPQNVCVTRSPAAGGCIFGKFGSSDASLIDAMLARPILINRPFVVTPLGMRLARPSERVLDIPPDSHKGPFSKEDGEAVIDAGGKRLV